MKQKALWALIGVFLLGLISGVFLDRAFLGPWGPRHWGWARKAERREARLLKYLSRKLDLSETQRAGIAPILRETRVELFKLRLEAGQEVDRIIEENGNRIRTLLNPEQAEEFDEIIKKFRERSRRWRHRGRRRRFDKPFRDPERPERERD
jgi:hypothetical protein